MKTKFASFRKQIKKDKWLLLFCLVLAFFAWQGIRKNIGFEVSVSNIAVDIDVPNDWAVWEKSVHRVNIVFRGSREDIRYLNNEQLRVVIPIQKPEQGDEMVIKLQEVFLRNPTGAKVVQFSPSEIVIKLDQKIERLLPVKAAFNGTLPEGLEIGRVVCTPASVRISGARQVLDEMENIHTEPLDLTDRQTSFKESVPIALPQAGRMLVDPDWVSVEFFLEARNSTEIFKQIPVRTMCAPGERRPIKIQPETIRITIQGKQQRIEQLRPAELFAYVNCHDLEVGAVYDLPVIMNLPSGLQLIKTDPTVVRVTLGADN